MLERFVLDSEVGAEHGRAEFVAVAAVADEGIHQVFTLDGLLKSWGISVETYL